LWALVFIHVTRQRLSFDANQISALAKHTSTLPMSAKPMGQFEEFSAKSAIEYFD
jgi:hypothetical protein